MFPDLGVPGMHVAMSCTLGGAPTGRCGTDLDDTAMKKVQCPSNAEIDNHVPE